MFFFLFCIGVACFRIISHLLASSTHFSVRTARMTRKTGVDAKGVLCQNLGESVSHDLDSQPASWEDAAMCPWAGGGGVRTGKTMLWSPCLLPDVAGTEPPGPRRPGVGVGVGLGLGVGWCVQRPQVP